MRFISFNVNGIRAIKNKSKQGQPLQQQEASILQQLIEEQQPDILALQEIKTQSIADLDFLKPYFPHIFINTAVKKGYSGTAILTKEEPQEIHYNFDLCEFEQDITDKSWNQEGRTITAIFETCIVVTVYVPNSKPKLARIDERLEWEEHLRVYLEQLEMYDRPIIVCGDLNVAPQPMDIHNKQRADVAGASPQERGAFQKLTEHFTDSFRYLHPAEQQWSWWSNFADSRARNKGWRIDLILVSTAHKNQIKEAAILSEYHGSDHCPVLLTIIGS
jgi:exodeoxyribonuclease-3